MYSSSALVSAQCVLSGTSSRKPRMFRNMREVYEFVGGLDFDQLKSVRIEVHIAEENLSRQEWLEMLTDALG
jgi:hypothetical protein